MNRGRSSDSLDNELDDIASSDSSCPSNFTSDDEQQNPDDYLMMMGQGNRVINKSRVKSAFGAKENLNNTLGSFINYNHLGPHESVQSSSTNARPILGSNNTNQLGFIDQHNIDASMASTSYRYNEDANINVHPSNLVDSRGRDESGSIPLLLDPSFGRRCNNQLENVGSHRLRTSHQPSFRPREYGDDDSENFIRSMDANLDELDDGDNEANVAMKNDDRSNDIVVRRNTNLFRRRMEPNVQSIGPNSAGVSNRVRTRAISVRMCARFVECRSLLEAIELVDQNRDLIETLTHVIRDAPAFRNYDMTQYEIDYSVKETFNPHFWHDRQPIITTADGNCQYHAVSLSLTGSEDYTQEVRLATVMAVIDNREWFDSILKLIDGGTVLDLLHTIARSYSWGNETTLKAIAVAIKRRIFLYTCNIGKKDYEMVKLLSKEELLDAFNEKKYRGGTGIHTYADPLCHVPANNYIMLFHKSEHFIAVLPTVTQPTMFEPYNPIVPMFT